MNMNANSAWEDSSFFGLIGQAFLNNYASEFDFKDNTLRLHVLDENDNCKLRGTKDSVKFEMVRLVPIVQTSIDN